MALNNQNIGIFKLDTKQAPISKMFTCACVGVYSVGERMCTMEFVKIERLERIENSIIVCMTS